MTIQDQIDAAITQLDAELSAKLGKPASVRYDFEKDALGTKAWIYSFAFRHGLETLARRPTIDEALVVALATVRAMRTKADEDADLGIA